MKLNKQIVCDGNPSVIIKEEIESCVCCFIIIVIIVLTLIPRKSEWSMGKAVFMWLSEPPSSPFIVYG